MHTKYQKEIGVGIFGLRVEALGLGSELGSNFETRIKIVSRDRS